MESDKPAADRPPVRELDRLERDDGVHATTVTDLIDYIERTAFERYLSDRELRRSFDRQSAHHSQP